MIIYTVAKKYINRDNYTEITKPVTVWYISEEEAIADRDKRNLPKERELTQRNKQEIKNIEKENIEYQALVAAGLREPRDPRKPHVRAKIEEPYVVVEDELFVTVEQLALMLLEE